MIYRLPMMALSAVALARVTLRRSSAAVSSKMVSSLMGSTGSPRLFFDDSFNGTSRTHGNKRFTPEVRRHGNKSTDDDWGCEYCKLWYEAWAATLELDHKTDALHFKVDMPWVDKKNLKVYVEDTFVICDGLGEQECAFLEDGEVKKEKIPKKYCVKVNLGPLRFYKVDRIEYELKNGTLKVKVPRVKHEERTDILHVRVM